MKKGKQVRSVKGEDKPQPIQVNHDNAPLLTVKFLEQIWHELKKLNEGKK